MFCSPIAAQYAQSAAEAAYTRRMGRWDQGRDVGIAVLFFGALAAAFVALFVLPDIVFRSLLMVAAVAAAMKAVVRPSSGDGNLWVQGGLVGLCVLVVMLMLIDDQSLSDPVGMITTVGLLVMWGAPLVRRLRVRKIGV
jgi:hypothetical protein